MARRQLKPSDHHKAEKALDANARFHEKIQETDTGRKSLQLQRQASDLGEEGLFEEAHELLLEAASLYMGVHKSEAAASVWFALADSYAIREGGDRESNLREARRLLEKMIESPAVRQTSLRFCAAHAFLGEILFDLWGFSESDDESEEFLKQAGAQLRKAISRAEKMGILGWGSLVSYHRVFGEIKKEAGDQKGALAEFQKGLNVAQAIENTIIPEEWAMDVNEIIHDLKLHLADALYREGNKRNFPRALQLAAEASEVQDWYDAPLAAFLAAKIQIDVEPENISRAAGFLKQALPQISYLADADEISNLMRKLGGFDVSAKLFQKLKNEIFRKWVNALVVHNDEDHIHEVESLASLEVALALDFGGSLDVFLALEQTSSLNYFVDIARYRRMAIDRLSSSIRIEILNLSSVSEAVETISETLKKVPFELQDSLVQEILSSFNAGDDKEDAEQTGSVAIDERRMDHLLGISLTEAVESKTPLQAMESYRAELKEKAKHWESVLAVWDPKFSTANRIVETLLTREELEEIVLKTPDTLYVRDHWGDDMVLVAIWAQEGEVQSRSIRLPISSEELELLEALLRSENGSDMMTPANLEELTEFLERLDLSELFDGLSLKRLVILPSVHASLIPWAAAGPSGKQLIDRFESIAMLPNLSPMREFRQILSTERHGMLSVMPGESIKNSAKLQLPDYPSIAFDRELPGESRLVGGDANISRILEQAAETDVICFFPRREPEEGDPVAISCLGEGLAGIESSAEWVGCERVELWGCRGGADAALDPDGFAVNEVFGLDIDFHRAGARSTIGTLWDVPDLVTAHIAKTYRERLFEGMDAPSALLSSQRHWKNNTLPRFLEMLKSKPLNEAIAALNAELGGGAEVEQIQSALSDLPLGGVLGNELLRAFIAQFSSPQTWAGFRFVGVHGQEPVIRPVWDPEVEPTPEDRQRFHEVIESLGIGKASVEKLLANFQE